MLEKLQTIRSKLGLLVIACAIPSVLFSGLFVYSEHKQYRKHVTQTAIASARAVASNLDKDLRGIESALQVLSISESLQDERLSEFHDTAVKALAFQNVNNFVLVDHLGRQRLNTLKPFGTKLPTTNAAPPEILAITEHKHTVVSNIFKGPVTGQPILAMGIPVVRQGQALYSLNVGIFPDRLYRLLKSQELPANWIGDIVDGKGNIVARTHDMDRFIGKPAVPALLQRLKTEREGVLELETLEGIKVISAFQHSSYSDWSVAVGAPESELMAELKGKIVLFIVLSMTLTGIAFAAAWLFAVHQIITPIEHLMTRMRSLAKREDSGSVLTQSSHEFRALEIGLEEMAGQLVAQETEKSDLLNQLITTLESITDGFILLDTQWRYRYINRRAEQLLGIHRETLANQDWHNHPPRHELAQANAPIENVLSSKTPINKLTVELNGDTPCVLELRFFRTSSGVAIYLVDITQQKQIAQAKAEKEAAEAANQAKNSFLARTSHELRTPLNAIVGLAQVLIHDRLRPLQPEHLRAIKLIESSSMHLMALINDILDISRAEAGSLSLKQEVIPIGSLLDECITMIQAEALSAGLRLRAPTVPADWCAWGDPIRVRQVLINLLSNAIKYNKPHGAITIECKKEAEFIELSVIDAGIGLSSDQIQQLYQPFNRLGMEKSPIPGTGMGLTISKFLLEKMGGTIAVQSTPSVGSKFTISIPVAQAVVAPQSLLPAAQTTPNNALLLVSSLTSVCQQWAALLANRPQLDVSFATTPDQVREALNTGDSIIVCLAADVQDDSDLRRSLDAYPNIEAAQIKRLPDIQAHTTDDVLAWVDAHVCAKLVPPTLSSVDQAIRANVSQDGGRDLLDRLVS